MLDFIISTKHKVGDEGFVSKSVAKKQFYNPTKHVRVVCALASTLAYFLLPNVQNVFLKKPPTSFRSTRSTLYVFEGPSCNKESNLSTLLKKVQKGKRSTANYILDFITGICVCMYAYFSFLYSYGVQEVVQKLLAVLLLVALEARRSGKKQNTNTDEEI